jgi:hypothetical protein
LEFFLSSNFDHNYGSEEVILCWIEFKFDWNYQWFLFILFSGLLVVGIGGKHVYSMQLWVHGFVLTLCIRCMHADILN